MEPKSMKSRIKRPISTVLVQSSEARSCGASVPRQTSFLSLSFNSSRLILYCLHICLTAQARQRTFFLSQGGKKMSCLLTESLFPTWNSKYKDRLIVSSNYFLCLIAEIELVPNKMSSLSGWNCQISLFSALEVEKCR